MTTRWKGSCFHGKHQKLLAELFGTFTLVFVGSVAIVGGGPSDVRLVSIALGFGLALLIGLYAFGEVSGGHFNPVVSLAMFLDKRLPAGDLVGYWIAQFAGATLASLVVLIAYDSATVATTVTSNTDTWPAFVIEVVLTALFLAIILQVTRSDKFGRSALTAIPLALVAIHVAAINISGASVNPARSFGPAWSGPSSTASGSTSWRRRSARSWAGSSTRLSSTGSNNRRDDLDPARARRAEPVATRRRSIGRGVRQGAPTASGGALRSDCLRSHVVLLGCFAGGGVRSRNSLPPRAPRRARRRRPA